MTCKDARYELPDFVRRKPADESAVTVAAHLEQCTSCRSELEQFRSLLMDLETVKPPSLSHSVDWASVLPRVHERIEKQRSFILPEWVQRFALPLAAAIAVALFVIKVIPLSTSDSFADLQATLQQLAPEELQDVAQQQSIAEIVEPASQDEQAITSDADTAVLKNILTDENNRSSVADLDHETLLQSLDEQEASDLVSMLEQASMN
ncbi:MAG: zf-HC2 domain-containing protein [Ignavibacteriae bacterium]|nr:zf-HC2 domain-containing protein [Ignavibacteria bacterium]MBI3364971.1 zf-HC2 domain-containing protein [Ignavibacteriota bacterium]